MQKRACENLQKHASHIFLDPIQKRASSRPVQLKLEAEQLKALLFKFFLYSSQQITEVLQVYLMGANPRKSIYSEFIFS